MSLQLERVTPPGVGGVAVLSLRGDGAADALTRIAGSLPRVGGLRLCRLELEGEVLDEALVVRRADTHFELGLHGSPAVVEAVTAALGGARPAAASEGPEGRALALLRVARTDRGARVLLDQARGALRREVEALRGVTQGVPCWRERHARARWLLSPPTVVLAGPVNAGKSTLFNLWVGEQRAVTSQEEGTTRDAIVAHVTLGHYQLELIDTAGQRGLQVPTGAQDAAAVEAMGQALAENLRGQADLVVWLRPPGEQGSVPPRALVVTSRCDEVETWPARGISVHADPHGSLARIETWVAEALQLPDGDPWTPGAGVPLEAGQAIDLDAAFEAPPGAERDAALDNVLGPAPHSLPLP